MANYEVEIMKFEGSDDGYLPRDTTKAPKSHSSSSDEYGLGTTSNYGHVKTQTGDMNGTSSTNGIAAGLGHTHSQYNATSTYSATGTTAVNGTAVAAAIGTLDGSISGTAGSGKTLTAFSQTDGKVSATFGNISITKSQVSDLSLGNASGKNYTTSVTSGSSDLVTSGAVYDAISGLPDAMVFKGSLGTGGTITSLPTNGSASIGDTYKVITAGTYASKAADVGDTFVCLTKTSTANTWEIIPSGDEPSGTVTSVGISNGGGLSVSGSPITSSGTITISHADTSSQASVNNSGRTYIQDITLDGYGHVTGISSATETVTVPNGFANVAVGSTTIAADTTTDTLTLTGSNVTLTPDATNDKVTIGITKDNVIAALGYTPGTSGLSLGETSSTAYYGDRGKAAYDHSLSAHAPSNAQANQNAFSNVAVGSTTIAADTTTDTLTLVGSNVTLTPDATNDKVTIGITKDNVTAALGYTPYNSTNPNGYTSNTGTITGITMNGSSKGTSGVVDLGTVLTDTVDGGVD